jgi:hypothetical protein
MSAGMEIIGKYMKSFVFTVFLAAAIAGGSAMAAQWEFAGFSPYAQAQRGRPGPGPGPGYDRGPDRSRDYRYERREERRERLTEDERRALHRDLDKANREIYGRRFQR